MSLQISPERIVNSLEECYFYHSMVLPGHGEISGEWDLRGVENENIGGLSVEGASVLEIGAASGYLSFWLEAQGARVSARKICL